MNITEANAVNAVLRYAFNLDNAPSVGEVREHAEYLAERAHAALAAGVFAEDVRRAVETIGGDTADTILALVRQEPRTTADLLKATKKSRASVWRATVALRERGEIHQADDGRWHPTPAKARRSRK